MCDTLLGSGVSVPHIYFTGEATRFADECSDVGEFDAAPLERVSLDFVVFEYINTDTVEDEVRGQ